MGRSLLSIFQEEDDEEPHSQQKEDARDMDYSIERIFESKEVPPWNRQLTFRAFAVSFVLAVLFTFIVMKLNLTTGIIPSLNVSAGLLGFFFVKMWTTILENFGMLKQPFTRQENTVIQTCVVAASGIAFSGGFGSYLFGMSEVVAKQCNEKYDHQNIKNPSVSWIVGFLFVVSFLGLCYVVPLRKIMLIDFNLIYPSGTATAHLINSFHTFHGAKQARRQIRTLGKFFSLSFLWGFFQWFFTAGEDCGFARFPTFGLTAYRNRFYFDFSTSYIGVGMMCPYMINISLLIGAILSWGLMWPLIALKEGTWYPPQAAESLRGLQGYKIFIAIAMILGDGVYNLVKVLGRTLIGLYKRVQKKDEGTNTNFSYSDPSLTYDQRRRIEFFLKDDIPTSVAICGYICVGIASAAGLPHMFPSLKWYYMIFIYAFAPVLAFCNAYGSGLTDWSLASTYGKLAIFIVGAWAGPDHGGILAGLATCGVMLNIVSTASELTQDFKTGYMTLSSPRSMFISQLIGTAMGCVISPLVFWLFYKAASGSMGLPDSQYPAPYAHVYRNMAVLGVNGFSILPTHCIVLCCAFFAAALIMNGARDTIGPRWARFIPIPMAMAIPFYIGGFFAIDMCVGSLILYVWKKMNRSNAEVLGPAMAAGLICGDGLWNLPSSLLTLNGVQPPICMKFQSREANTRLAAFSGGA